MKCLLFKIKIRNLIFHDISFISLGPLGPNAHFQTSGPGPSKAMDFYLASCARQYLLTCCGTISRI